jgi:hypothetical protein
VGICSHLEQGIEELEVGIRFPNEERDRRAGGGNKFYLEQGIEELKVRISSHLEQGIEGLEVGMSSYLEQGKEELEVGISSTWSQGWKSRRWESVPTRRKG